MSYCKYCGTELQNGARFCAVCGTPTGQDQPYINTSPAAGAQPPVNGTQSYTGGQPTNGVQPYAGGQPTNGAQPYAGGQPTNGVQPYAGGQPTNGVQPYAGGQPTNGAQPYAGGQPTNGAQPYAGGAPYAGGQTYAGGQPMNEVQTYQNMPTYAGGYSAGSPYNPYGAAVQPQSSRKALAIVGAIVGLIVTIALVLLIVLLTRDNSHRTYQQVIGVFMNGFEKRDLGKVSEAFPERIRSEMRRELSWYYDTEREMWEDYEETLEWYCGDHVKMTYTIGDAKPLLEYQIRDYEEEWMEEYRYNVSISSAYAVEVEVTYKGSEGEYSENLHFEVGKIDGKWYVLDMDN